MHSARALVRRPRRRSETSADAKAEKEAAAEDGCRGVEESNDADNVDDENKGAISVAMVDDEDDESTDAAVVTVTVRVSAGAAAAAADTLFRAVSQESTICASNW